MDKIIMLGTGNGATLDLYNTCFIIQNNSGDFLIDTGGSIEIIKRMQQYNIDYKQLKHIFISHSHTDHILGLFWIFKFVGVLAIKGKINYKINIYCNDVVCEAIKGISAKILPDKLLEALDKVIDFKVLNDGDKHTINGVEYKFFDIRAKGTKQFGFECYLNNKKLVFLGDETCNPILYDRLRNADYVMHEAFCLDSEEYIFHAYEKNHSTAKSVSEVMNNLNVKNLILYHTEESHKEDRKKLYTEEANKYFKGNVIVPNDLETIEL